MKKSKINISLNDSDDAAFLFEIGTQKRKIKPISPKVKRRRGNNKDSLTQSVIEKPSLRERKPQLNRSAPETTNIANAQKEMDFKNLVNGIENPEQDKKSNGLEASNKVNGELPKNKDNIFSHFLSKAKTSVTGLVCPLCKKFFENSLSHVSHMKLCAKKKKVSTTQLLKSIDSLKEGGEVISIQDSALRSSSSKAGNKRSEGLLNSIDSQMATLEKFGFMSSTGASKTGNRRGRLKLNRNTVLKSRTTEERMRILTEKAAVILLTDEDIAAVKVEVSGSTPESEVDEIPSSLEHPKQHLWDIGNCDRSNSWYIDNLKEFVIEKNIDDIDNTTEDTFVGTVLSESRSSITEMAIDLPFESNSHEKSLSPRQKLVAEDETVPSSKDVLSENAPIEEITFIEDSSMSVGKATANKRTLEPSLPTDHPLNNINNTEYIQPTLSPSHAFLVKPKSFPDPSIQSPAPMEKNIKISETVLDPQSPELFIENQNVSPAKFSSTADTCLLSPKSNISVRSDTTEEITLVQNESIDLPLAIDGQRKKHILPLEPVLSKISPRKSLTASTVVPKTIHNSGTLTENWGKLVGNSLFSDRTLTTSDGEVFIHSLVLNVRCPNINIDDLEMSCRNINKSSLLIFLKYLYTDIFDSEQITFPEQIKKLSDLFKRPEVINNLNEMLTLNNLNISELAMTPIQATCLKLSTNFENLSEADTVPVSISTNDDDVAAVVDLTQNDPSDNEDTYEKSCWNLLNQNNEVDDERLDVLEKQREIAKIQSFFEINKSKNHNSDSDEDFMIDNREREKIYNLSQNGGLENDLFDSTDDDDILVLTQTRKPDTEVVCVSDDSEQRFFDKSTDDDNSNHHFNDDFDVPFFDSYDNHDFIDYNKTAQLGTTSPQKSSKAIDYDTTSDLNGISPSQSLVSAPDTPRTPRKVLETPVLDRNMPFNSSILEAGVIAESPDDFADENRNSVHNRGTSPLLTSPSQHVTPVAGRSQPINNSTPECLPGSPRLRSSERQKNKKQAVSSPNSKARRSLLENNETNGAALSDSVLAALDETWQNGDNSQHVTPIANKAQFLEVTPNLTPSTKIVNKITPRPRFSSMKTGSLKKHLQKYGLKQNLGKVKAKKILGHIYDELHPFVNPKTGKFLKKLPEENVNKTKSRKKNASPKNVKKKGPAVKSKQAASSSPDPVGNSPKKNKTIIGGVPSFSSSETPTEELGSCINNAVPGPSTEQTATENDADDSEFIDSDHSNYSENEFDIGDDDEDDDETGVLTQTNNNMKDLSTAEIVIKFINENQTLHESILKYEPVWIKSLHKDICSSYNIRLKIRDLTNYLDSACIIWKSEVQAANMKQRNERTKQRRMKRKEKLKKSSSAQ